MNTFESFDNIPEPESHEEEQRQPSTERLMLQEALKTLSAKQRRVWEMYAYDRKTHDEIARWEGVSRPVITRRIQVIEKKIAKWCKDNIGAYNVLKKETEEFQNKADGYGFYPDHSFYANKRKGAHE